VGDSGLILTTSDGGTTWSVQNSGVSNTLRTVTFYDVDHGIAGGSGGAILSTANGGRHWRGAPAISSVLVSSSWMLDASTGWLAGHNVDFISGARGYIYRTSDGGQSWNSAQMPNTDSPMFDVQFLDPFHGFCVEGYIPGYLYRSTDGGASWSVYYQNGLLQLTELSFVDSLHGFLAGTQYGLQATLLATADGGVAWTGHPLPAVTGALDIAFRDTLQGWVIGGGGAIRRTNDGGLTWTAESSFTTHDLMSITVRGDSIGWITGLAGTLLKLEPDVPTRVSGEQPAHDFEILQNYPNPFNPSTTIRFTVPQREHVLLQIFDLEGRAVATLRDGFSDPGAFELNWNASEAASGVYLCRLVAGQESVTRKLILLR
jgi:photosystem II stability/assembly factor-like uncharacterized protein